MAPPDEGHRRLTPTGPAAPTVEAVAAGAARYGLLASGAFHPMAEDAVPALADGRESRTLVLLGHAGPAMWESFRVSPELALGDDPLDRWSQRVVGELAQTLGGEPLFPFGGPPFLPFGKWAQRSGAVFPSPLGILIHREFGLWHGYRGALAFSQALVLPPSPTPASPCLACAEKPCLAACPVGAFSSAGYAMADCLDHLRAAAGAGCRDGGCRARLACPVGSEYRYPPGQMRFHMRQFVRGWGDG